MLRNALQVSNQCLFTSTFTKIDMCIMVKLVTDMLLQNLQNIEISLSKNYVNYLSKCTRGNPLLIDNRI